MLSTILFDVSDAVVLGLGGLVGLATFFFMRYLQSLPVSDAPDCPWHERLFSWGKRHVTWVLAGGFLGLLLFVPQIAQRLTFWAQGAAPISPKQENVDGAQELASRLAGGCARSGRC